MKRFLVLQDGSIFEGTGYGYTGERYGELVFTTSMTGYLESLSDPSYRNQILVFASPTIGNYPFEHGREESSEAQVSGLVTRDAHATLKSGPEWDSFNDYLIRNHVPGIDTIDTRALVRRIRDRGVERAYITSYPELKREFGDPMAEDVVSKVSCKKAYGVNTDSKYKILYIDVGTKKSLLNEVSKIADLYVVPYNYNFPELEWNYDAVFISNGPGDPSHESLRNVVEFIKDKSGTVPIFGVCLGHQLISLAFGAKTVKMKFGHRGSNHAVSAGNKILITTHNHGYAVDEASMKSTGLQVTQKDINDGIVEGLKHAFLPIYSIQYHPEASPGPHDAKVFFEFIQKEVAKRHAD